MIRLWLHFYFRLVCIWSKSTFAFTVFQVAIKTKQLSIKADAKIKVCFDLGISRKITYEKKHTMILMYLFVMFVRIIYTSSQSGNQNRYIKWKNRLRIINRLVFELYSYDTRKASNGIIVYWLYSPYKLSTMSEMCLKSILLSTNFWIEAENIKFLQVLYCFLSQPVHVYWSTHMNS